MTLNELNRLPEAAAREAFERCCGAAGWVRAMVAARPFGSAMELLEAAECAAESLGREGWLEAFAHHPKIGDVEALRTRFASSGAWAGAASASEATLRSLADGNREYEARFGYIFVVCATGMRADEMLASLRSRLRNDPEHEMSIAADEQRRITRLRLEKLLAGD